MVQMKKSYFNPHSPLAIPEERSVVSIAIILLLILTRFS